MGCQIIESERQDFVLRENCPLLWLFVWITFGAENNRVRILNLSSWLFPLLPCQQLNSYLFWKLAIEQSIAFPGYLFCWPIGKAGIGAANAPSHRAVTALFLYGGLHVITSNVVINSTRSHFSAEVQRTLRMYTTLICH